MSTIYSVNSLSTGVANYASSQVEASTSEETTQSQTLAAEVEADSVEISSEAETLFQSSFTDPNDPNNGGGGSTTEGGGGSAGDIPSFP